MSKWRGILVGLALSIGSLLTTLVALELALRTGWFTPREYRSTAIDVRVASDPRRPNFRDESFELEDKGDAFRIVVVGDSFAWGDGVHPEDSFPARLETRLQSVSRGTRFEVVNWSRPGWNTVRQVQSLEAALPRLDPDILLVAFVLNDPEPLDGGRRDALLAPAKPRTAVGIDKWFFQHSRLYALVWMRLENRRQHRALGAYYRSLFEGEHWQACLKALRRLGRMCREEGVPLILSIFPVFDGPMDDSYAYADLHERLRIEAEASGIPVLDLFALYRGVEGRRLAVTPFTDAHPNELAHRLAADGILDYLVRRDMVPPVRYRPFRQQKARRKQARSAPTTD